MPSRILVSDKALLQNPTTHYRFLLAPSSVAGRFRVLTLDGARVLSVQPDGSVLFNPVAGHDGGYEAGQLIGTRLIYDYPEMNPGVNPVIYDVVVTE